VNINAPARFGPDSVEMTLEASHIRTALLIMQARHANAGTADRRRGVRSLSSSYLACSSALRSSTSKRLKFALLWRYTARHSLRAHRRPGNLGITRFLDYLVSLVFCFSFHVATRGSKSGLLRIIPMVSMMMALERAIGRLSNWRERVFIVRRAVA